MIAEPYIRIKGPAAGEISTIDWRCETEEFIEQKDVGGVTYVFERYDGFEREKLQSLGYLLPLAIHASAEKNRGYHLEPWKWNSRDLIGYDWFDYCRDTEAGRLFKRAEFLKAVCEKEGVAWLPKDETAKEDRRCPKCKAEGEPGYLCCYERSKGGYILPSNLSDDEREKLIKHIGEAVMQKLGETPIPKYGLEKRGFGGRGKGAC